MTPQTDNTAAESAMPSPAKPSTALALPAIDPAEIETIVHDIFLVGLAAAAFFIKNPQTATRAGRVVGILQGLQIGGTAPTGN